MRINVSHRQDISGDSDIGVEVENFCSGDFIVLERIFEMLGIHDYSQDQNKRPDEPANASNDPSTMSFDEMCNKIMTEGDFEDMLTARRKAKEKGEEFSSREFYRNLAEKRKKMMEVKLPLCVECGKTLYGQIILSSDGFPYCSKCHNKKWKGKVRKAEKLWKKEIDAIEKDRGNEKEKDDEFAIRCYLNGERLKTHELTKEQAKNFRHASVHLADYLSTEYSVGEGFYCKSCEKVADAFEKTMNELDDGEGFATFVCLKCSKRFVNAKKFCVDNGKFLCGICCEKDLMEKDKQLDRIAEKIIGDNDTIEKVLEEAERNKEKEGKEHVTKCFKCGEWFSGEIFYHGFGSPLCKKCDDELNKEKEELVSIDNDGKVFDADGKQINETITDGSVNLEGMDKEKIPGPPTPPRGDGHDVA